MSTELGHVQQMAILYFCGLLNERKYDKCFAMLSDLPALRDVRLVVQATATTPAASKGVTDFFLDHVVYGSPNVSCNEFQKLSRLVTACMKTINEGIGLCSDCALKRANLILFIAYVENDTLKLPGYWFDAFKTVTKSFSPSSLDHKDMATAKGELKTLYDEWIKNEQPPLFS
jgi:hypothetical protein